MSEREGNNVFRFSLYQGDVLLCEKAFDADQFNPFTRYSVDIRDILPTAISRLQKVLSKRNYDTRIEVGRMDINVTGSQNHVYDLYDYYVKVLNSYPHRYRDDMRYNPQPVTQQIDDRVFYGVECKIGFYINDNPIVERFFYVNGFNPVSRWSVDLTDTVMYIVDAIYTKIKNNDIKNMWANYDSIKYRNLPTA